jgi:TPR repeat protein
MAFATGLIINLLQRIYGNSSAVDPSILKDVRQAISEGLYSSFKLIRHLQTQRQALLEAPQKSPTPPSSYFYLCKEFDVSAPLSAKTVSRRFAPFDPTLKVALYFVIAENMNDPYAQLLCGRALEFGDCVDQNLARAAQFYRLSAINGCAAGASNFARCLALGEGIARNLEASELFYMQATLQCDTLAFMEYALGIFYGWWGDNDLRLAASYLLISAEQGCADAQYYYGRCLRDGYGVDVDKKSAAKFFELSAQQGCVDALPYYDECLQNISNNENIVDY